MATLTFQKMSKILTAVFILVAITTSHPAFSQELLTSQQINDAEFDGHLPEGQSAVVTNLQILLHRAGANPGVIDGIAGENVSKAVQG